MILTIEVTGELEATLKEQAEQRGVPAEQVAQDALAIALARNDEREGVISSPKWASAEEKANAFMEWAKSHRESAPPLSDEAVSRASVYPDRW